MNDTQTQQAERPAPPADLEGEALIEWGRLCDDLEKAGTLATASRGVMELYCRTWATYQQNARHVAKFGAIVKHANGMPMQNPAFKVMNALSEQLRRLLIDMRLTPGSRRTTDPAEEPPLVF
jgi:P27 family predicted phage terminase small subunit